jgi:hypothetical protein
LAGKLVFAGGGVGRSYILVFCRKSHTFFRTLTTPFLGDGGETGPAKVDNLIQFLLNYPASSACLLPRKGISG